MKTTKCLLIIATLMSGLCASFQLALAIYAKWVLYAQPDVTSPGYQFFAAKMNFAFYSGLIGSGWFIVMTTLLILAIRRLKNSN
jgi:hypothetical protein